MALRGEREDAQLTSGGRVPLHGMTEDIKARIKKERGREWSEGKVEWNVWN